MDRPTTPGGSPYGRPPAYDDEDGFSPQMQGGSTMRLLTNVEESQSYMPRHSFESASIMSGVNSTRAALGERMTPSEIGRQKTAEAGIVDFLREAGDALSSNDHAPAAGAGLSTQMPRRKTLKSRT
ncbi:predicted protein [Plenodomus lingam JN3]|uniref:Predicted protein n=1 Tax=Leptosphaeria maculans (strain JN3 / isolate v23.1.3 / race Av1-4-5-6-7-8) TaxID=985895 RepID=E4ZH85_LEPMJ|nr:predicted protein [Plenodomus lingam JN3]CBX90655.1 predicted protein [Plenodomus lingam JN3]